MDVNGGWANLFIVRGTEMEIDDLRAMNDDDLDKELHSTHRELMNLRFRVATMQLSDTNQIRKSRKRISRINTILRERELATAEL